MFKFFKRSPRIIADKAETLAKGSNMSDTPVNERIQTEINSQDVVLFMKGSPLSPQCGFSAATVQALSMTGVKFGSVDILQDMEIREGIKQFSNWPTIPQLYVKGEFIGGCDIVREMFESGELRQLFEEKSVKMQDVRAE